MHVCIKELIAEIPIDLHDLLQFSQIAEFTDVPAG